jgi:transposase-like protein
MARKRKARGKELKSKVALAAVAGQSPSQIASRFGVHPTQVAVWKKQLVERAEELFADGRRKESSEVNEQELYEQLGRLQMELAWLKKKVAQVQ